MRLKINTGASPAVSAGINLMENSYMSEQPTPDLPGTEDRPNLAARLYKSKHVRSSLVLFVAAVVVILVAIPYAMEYTLEYRLKSVGADEANVGDVDMNVFLGRLRVEDVTVRKGGTETLLLDELSAGISYLSLFKKRVYLRHLTVTGLVTGVDSSADGPPVIGGLVLSGRGDEEKDEDAAAEGKGDGWGLGLEDLEILASRIDYTTGGLSTVMVIDRMSLRGVETWNPEASGAFEFDGKIAGGDFTMESTVSPFPPDRSAEGRITLAGLRLSTFSGLVGRDLDGELDMDTRLSFSTPAGGGLALTQDGSVGVRGAGLAAGAIELSAASAAWTGKVMVSVGGDDGPTRVGALDGAFTAGGLRGLVEETGYEVFSVDGLAFEGVGLSEKGGYRVGGVSIDGVSAGVPEGFSEGLLAAASVKVGGAAYSGASGVTLEDASIEGLRSVLIRTEDRAVPAVAGLGAVRAGPAADEAEGSEAVRKREKKGGLRAGLIDLSGTSIVWDDRSLTPPYKAVVKVEKAVVEGLDTETADGSYRLAGTVNEYTGFEFSGAVGPLSTGINLDLSGNLNTLDLPPLSAYAVRNLGYDFRSGHMNAEVEMDVDSGVMDGEVRVLLSNLEVQPVDEAKLAELQRELTMPLGAALSLLRDRDGDIRFTIPVEGDITSPRFDLAGVVNKAVGGAMKKAAITYLKYYFQPYGTLITLASMAGEAVTRVRLDPVFFEPGVTRPGPEATVYLDKVGGFLTERPEVRLKVCGFAAESEIDELPHTAPATDEGKGARLATPEGRLSNAGRVRATRVKDYLVTEHGIASERLFICSPEVDASEEGRPRVELLV